MTAQAKKNFPQVTPIRTDESASNLRDEIRLRAYELYEHRGRQDGHDLEDWLQSEAEVRSTLKKTRGAA